jgi:hypothetical protein
MCLACEVYGNIHGSQPVILRRSPEKEVVSAPGADLAPPTSDRPPAQTAGTSDACKEATNES